MKITCGSCGAKYTVSDDKVHGKTVKVKCRKCSAVIVVSSSGEVQTTGGSAASAATPDAAFTVSVSDTDQRSMTMSEIVAAYNEGVIDAETYVWSEGMDDWQPLKDVDAIVDALHDAASTTGEAGPTDLSSTVAMTDASDSDYGNAGYGYGSAPAAYAAQPAYSGGGGGGIAAAAMGGGGGGGMDFGSTVALPQASPYDASSPRGAGGAGFFATTPSPAVPSGGEGGAENSAIFSLNMLTAKVGSPAASPSIGGGGGGGGGGMGLGVGGSGVLGTTEDSGLIDLKALAAGMGSEGVAAHSAHVPVADGVFPLGAPAMQPMPTAASIPAPAPSGGRAMVLGLGMAVLVLAAALIFFIVKDSGDTNAGKGTSSATQPGDKTPSATQPQPGPAPVPATTDSTAPAPDPSDAASAAPSSSQKVAVRPGPVGPRTGPQPTPGPGPRPTPTPTPTPGKGGGACGCASDDLMCHMRCSQKGGKKKK